MLVMAITNSEIIYQQRYEVYRHLDRLRWQMMQIGITAGSIALTFGSKTVGNPEWWVWLAVGIVLFFTGAAMMRIGSGIRANAKILCIAGKVIGDVNIPGKSPGRQSVAFWIAMTMMIAGVVSSTLAIRPFV